MSSSHSSEDPPSIESATQLMEPDLPTASTIKKYKMQIQLDQPLDNESYSSNGISHYYRPGDTVNGDLLVIPPSGISSEDSIKFNEISISLQCKVTNNVGGKARTLFTMNDETSSIPESFDSEMKFPFHFEIPTQLFDNICPHNIELHKQVPPSFGSPKLCSMAFSGTENAGVKPTECLQYAFYKELALNKFCVVYYITATIGQKTHRTTNASIILKRVLDISVKNNFEPIPTNLSQTSLDIASHYSITNFAPNNELLQVQRTFLKTNNEQIGRLSSLTELPSPISISAQSDTETAQISLIFKAIGSSTLPELKYHAQLTQFVIQSSTCVPATANPVIKNLTVETIGETRKATVRGKTLKASVTETHWRPGYHTSDDYYVKDINVEIPHLAKQNLEPTFHSCTLQNVYLLDVDIIHEKISEFNGSSCEESKSGFKNTLLDKIGIKLGKNDDTCLSIHKAIQQNGGFSVQIPVTLLA